MEDKTCTSWNLHWENSTFNYKKSKTNQHNGNQIWTIDMDKWLFANPKSTIQYLKTYESSITKNN